MDGSVLSLVKEFFHPVERVFEYAFVLGAAYGVKHLAGFAWGCWRAVRVYCVPFRRCIENDLTERFGKWAVVLGATSALGEAYAEELARRGVCVVLISKSYEDLVQLVVKIQLVHSVQAYGIHADLSLGRHVYQEIEEALDGYEIGIFVNCLAVVYDHPQYFILVPSQRVCQILDVNIAAATLMTYILLPQMVQRKRGVVINLCSHVSILPPSPLLAAYSASMTYMSNLSESLSYEVSEQGVIVQTLLPGLLAQKNSPPSLFTPRPSTYVRHALSTLGVASTTSGYWPHSLQIWLCSCVPRWLWLTVMFQLHKRQRQQNIAEAKRQGANHFTRRKRANFGPPPSAFIPPHSTFGPRPAFGSSASAFAPPSPGFVPPSPTRNRRTSAGGLILRRTPSPKKKIPSQQVSTDPFSSGGASNICNEGAFTPARITTFESVSTSLRRPRSPSVVVTSDPSCQTSSLLPKRYSRVMVVPSVAKFSQHGPQGALQTPNNPQTVSNPQGAVA